MLAKIKIMKIFLIMIYAFDMNFNIFIIDSKKRTQNFSLLGLVAFELSRKTVVVRRYEIKLKNKFNF